MQWLQATAPLCTCNEGSTVIGLRITKTDSLAGQNGVLSQDPKGSIPRDPYTGGCGMVKFIWVEIEGCPQVPNVSSPRLLRWKKPSLVFIWPRNRASVQTFCNIGLVHVSVPIRYISLLLAGAVPSPMLSAEGPRRLLGTHGYGERTHKHTGWVHVTRGERERVFVFVRLRLYHVWHKKNQAPFQTNQSTSQSFSGIHWVFPLTNSFPRSSMLLCPLSNPKASPGYTDRPLRFCLKTSWLLLLMCLPFPLLFYPSPQSSVGNRPGALGSVRHSNFLVKEASRLSVWFCSSVY